MRVTTLETFDTEYCADTVEWCPHSEYRNYFVCGTYELYVREREGSTSPTCGGAGGDNTVMRSSVNRKGRLMVYLLDKETRNVTEIQRIETSAILDIKWLIGCGDTPYMAAANAIGQVEFYDLIDGNLRPCGRSPLNSVSGQSTLTLSVDWDWWPTFDDMDAQPTLTADARRLIATDSSGYVSLFTCSNERLIHKVRSWRTHSFEAWTCCFDKWDENRFFTGGDDAHVSGWDSRAFNRVLDNTSNIAGVTSLLSHPRREHLLITGSYDEQLRLFDVRNFSTPVCALNMAGGIWRIKPDPLRKDYLLTACMYKNMSFVEIKNADATTEEQPKQSEQEATNAEAPIQQIAMNLLGGYEEHNSICYGADWCFNAKPEDVELFVATCSFYDHKLCVSSVLLNENEEDEEMVSGKEIVADNDNEMAVVVEQNDELECAINRNLTLQGDEKEEQAAPKAEKI